MEMHEMKTHNGNGRNQTDDLMNGNLKVVTVRTINGTPLGITLRNEERGLVVARVLCGGIVDRQGLLGVGDTILEVNGNIVKTRYELKEQMKKFPDIITLVVRPSNQDSNPKAQTFYKTLFAYDASKDSLLPCADIGLSFKQGDILEILNQDDPNWWQARRVGSDGGHAGLVPSQDLEERRRAFVPPEFDCATRTTMCGTKVKKNKRKTMYQICANAEFDKAELLLYEEVAQMPPFERKVLILLGAQGIGKRSLKQRLVRDDSSRFATVVPRTSRPKREGEVDGHAYVFLTRSEMEADIAENKYLEHGELNGQLYGTTLESVRSVIRDGKMCVLDCNPQSLKVLKGSEFMPYVVFVATPGVDQLKNMNELRGRNTYASNRSLTFDRAMGRHGSRRARTMESLASVYEEEDLKAIIEEGARLQRAYEKYFDLVILNSNFDHTFSQLKEAIDVLATEPQWVPTAWVY